MLMLQTEPMPTDAGLSQDRHAARTIEDYRERIRRFGAVHNQMLAVSDIYNNRAVVPLPEAAQDAHPTVPNLLSQGIDQLAGRIASVQPMPSFATLKPGNRRSERKASTSGRVVQAWWAKDGLPLKMLRRARHLVAYGMTPCVVTYDPKTQYPCWGVRDPRTCYPDPDLLPGEVGDNAIFTYRRSGQWLVDHGYTGALYRLGMDPREVTRARHQSFLLLETVIAEQGRSLVLAGTGTDIAANDLIGAPSLWAEPAINAGVTLEWTPPGTAYASVPTRLSLDDTSGQFDTMIGMYHMQARLMAMEELAIEKSIYPDVWIESNPGDVGRVIDGPYDGRSGKISVLTGGRITIQNLQPGYQTGGTMDRLERASRLTAGIPSEFGGESGSNIRTGRRGDAVLSAVIDAPIAEAQAILAAALACEDRAAIRLARFYDHGAQRTLRAGQGNNAVAVTYVADDVFEDDPDHTVNYPITGADLNSLMVGIGQRVGIGTMSKQTAAEIDPMISNPEMEHDRIIAEGLEQALVTGFEQQAMSGQIPPATIARVMTLVSSDQMELADAIMKTIQEAQAAAAEQQQAQAQQMPSPEQAMAGPAAAALSGNPQAASPIAGPTQGQGDVASLLSTLRKPLMGVGNRVGVSPSGESLM